MDARRRRIEPGVAREMGEAAARIACDEPEFAAAPRVGLYAAKGGEVQTRALFEALGNEGCERIFPRVRGHALEWASLGSWGELEPGRFGILEPPGDSVDAPGPSDFVCVPGLAFDAEGWRLGRGGGYYDRAFPASRPGPRLVGLAYAFQVIAAVPHDSRDRRVDAIVTESEWLWTREMR
jgi:5-formyltetrahydrofolate cyclo-ligase